MKEVGLSFVTRLDSVEGRRISDNPKSSIHTSIILAKFFLPYLLSSRPNGFYNRKKISFIKYKYFLLKRKPGLRSYNSSIFSEWQQKDESNMPQLQ